MLPPSPRLMQNCVSHWRTGVGYLVTRFRFARKRTGCISVAGASQAARSAALHEGRGLTSHPDLRWSTDWHLLAVAASVQCEQGLLNSAFGTPR